MANRLQKKRMRKRPSPRSYLRRLILCSGSQPLYLTEKLKDSLLRGLALARDMNAHVYSNRLMYGLIAARSIAIPILDSASVNVSQFAARLRKDPIGLQDESDDDDFYCDPRDGRYLHSYKCLDDIEDARFQGLYWIMRCARCIANANGQPAIDTATFLRAIFRMEFDGDADKSEEDLNQLAQQPLAKQIQGLLRKAHACAANYSLQAADEIIERSGGIKGTLGPVVRALSPYIKNPLLSVARRASSYAKSFART
jgi:hypothetical protein